MFGVLACSLVLAALFLVVGAPLAIAIRGPGEGVAALLYDALVLGLVAITIGTFAFGWYGSGWAIAFGVCYCGGAGYALLRRLTLPRRIRIYGWTYAAALACVVAAALRLRMDRVTVWTDDQGGYVNWANEFVRTGHLRTSYPPGLPSYLAIAGKLFGVGYTTAGIPLLGMLLIFSLLRVFGQLRVAPIARVAVVAIVAVQLHALWYSSYPAAEALHAPLLISLISLIITALRSQNRRLVACCGAILLVTTMLALNRASTVLLLAPLAILAAGCWTRTWSRYARSLSFAATAMLLGVYAGYLFGVREIYPYYVTLQIGDLLPLSVFRRLSQHGIFAISHTLLALMVVGLIVVLLPGILLPRIQSSMPKRRHRAEHPSSWPFVFGIALTAVGIGLVAFESSGEAAAAMGRVGWWLPLAGGLALLVPRTSRGVRGPAVVFAASTAALFLLVEIVRFGAVLEHPIYLYFDRYLFSEYLPCLLLIVGVGADALVRQLALRSRRRVAVIALAGLTAAAIVSYVGADWHSTRHTMFAGAYEFEAQVAKAVRPDPAPVLWSATSDAGIPGLFPNTHFPIGLTTQMTFGTDFINVGTVDNVYDPDQIVGHAAIMAALGKDRSRVYIVDFVQPSGPPLDQRAESSDYALQHVATVSGHTDLLAQQPGAKWVSAPLVAQIWLATRQTASS